MLPAEWKFIGYFCLGYPQADDTIPELEQAGWEQRRLAVVASSSGADACRGCAARACHHTADPGWPPALLILAAGTAHVLGTAKLAVRRVRMFRNNEPSPGEDRTRSRERAVLTFRCARVVSWLGRAACVGATAAFVRS